MPGSVCRLASVKPRKDLRKGILKKADGSKSKPRMAVRWVAGDITSTKVVDRWIVPHEHIAPNMDRITGTIWGWKATPLGEEATLQQTFSPPVGDTVGSDWLYRNCTTSTATRGKDL
ncbi:MAG: hypothetical protein Q9228_007400 [Teloschistes exilis]